MTTETKLHQALSLILYISRQGRALEGEKREKKMGEIYKAALLPKSASKS